MSFIADNKYFLSNKIFGEMKGFDLSQRRVKFNDIKDEIRMRLKASYSSTNNKPLFYKEAFETLFDYESDYLLYNLFLESDYVNILSYLKTNAVLDKINIYNEHSILANFKNYILAVPNIDRLTIINFIKCTYVSKVKYWNDKNDNAFIHAFVEFLKNENYEVDILSAFEIHFLLTKVWNDFDEFKGPNVKLKTTVFYALINKELSDNQSKHVTSDLYSLIEEFKKKYSSLFVNVEYIPMLINEVEFGESGCTKQIVKFKESVKRISQINCFSIDKDYVYLINMLCSNDSIINDRIRRTIKEKILNFHYPTSEEIDIIKNIDCLDKKKVVLSTLRMLYIFEEYNKII